MNKKQNKILGFVKRRVRVRTLVALGLIVCILPVILLNIFKPGGIKAVWFDDNWSYRNSLSFTHNASVTTSTKVKFDIDTATLITANKMQSDCGDSRFTDLNGKTLPYYIDSAGGACNTSSTDYYVLIPTINNGTNVIYHYYGNPSALNGTASIQFSESTTSPSGGAASSGSEEKGTGPIAYWSFDEGADNTCSGGTNDACDRTSNDNDGAFGASTAAPTWKTDDMCVSGKCLFFDGSNDYINITHSASLNIGATTDSYSVSFWLRTPQTADRHIVHKYSSGLGGYPFAFEINPSGASNKIRFKIYDQTNAPGTTSTTSINDNRWHLITGVRSVADDKVYIFVDGKQESSATDTTTTSTASTADMQIGRDSLSGPNFYNGFIDEPKIYKYARSAGQVQADFASRGSIEGSSVSFGGDNQKFLSDGLVGYWKTDEASWSGSANEVVDSSGNSNHGVRSGNATTASGKFGNGGTFDGTGDYASVADSDSLDVSTGVTVSAWVKPTAFTDSSYEGIVWKQNVADANQSSAYALTANYSSNSLSFFATTDRVDGGQVEGGSDMTTGTWNHVVATYDSATGTTRLYLNGVLQVTDSTTLSGTITATTSVVKIGERQSWDWNGSIDEVRIYNRALSGAEIRNLYNFAPGPIGYWKMDEKVSGNSKTVFDSSGNGFSGTTSYGANTSGMDCKIAGKFGGGCKFDGTDDDVNIYSAGLASAFNSSAGTVSGWFKVSGSSVWTDGNTHRVIYLQASFANGIVEINKNGVNNRVVLLYKAGGTSSTVTFDSISSTDWMNVALTWDKAADQVKGYINGVAGTTQTGLGTWSGTLGASTTVIGANTSSGGTTWDGSLDEVKIYNYARTSQQVIEDMNGGHPTGGSPVGSYVSYWKMDEGQGTAAHDANTTNANDLTLSSASWSVPGKINNGWNGEGSKYLSRADDGDFDFTASEDFSISMWFKSDGASNPGATEYLLAKGPTAAVGYGIYANTSGQICFGIDDDTSSFPEDSSCSTLDVYDATWHHVVATKTGTYQVQVLVDKKPQTADTSISATGTLANSSSLYVGDRNGTNDGDEFTGDIDEVKIYRSALTQDQVNLDYNAGSSLSFGVLSSTSEAAQMSDGAGNPPVAYWNFDEKSDNTCAGGSNDACDHSGNGNDGAWSGTPGTQWVQGKYGSGIKFNGVTSTDKIALTANQIANFQQFTIETWGNYDGVSSTPAFFGANTGGQYWRSLNGSNIYLYLKNSTCAGGEVMITNSYIMQGWHHYSLTVAADGTTKLYRDGSLFDTQSFTTYQPGQGAWDYVCPTSTDWANIGNYAGNPSWSGTLDDFKIYNYARTQAQVAYDYNRGAPVGWWKFDECNGSTANDNSGNGNNGTITIGASGEDTLGTCITSSTAWGSGASGKFNSSLNLDGTDDYITGTLTSSLSPSLITLSLWWNAQSTGDYQYLIDTNHDGSGGFGYTIQVKDDLTAFYVSFGGVNSDIPTNLTFIPGQWYLITATVDGTSVKTYINGILKNTNNSSGTVAYSGGSFNIGRRNDGTLFTKGQIDDVRVYNYPLSATQIQKLYNDNSGVYFGPATGQP